MALLAATCAAAQDPQASPLPPQSKTEAPLAVVARLTKSLSAKKLRPGDKVTAIVIQDVVVAGKVFMARDTRLHGRVIEVQPQTKTDPRSRLVMVFESRTPKEGGTLPMRGVVQALAPPLPDPFLEAVMASSSPYAAGENGHPVNGAIMSTGQTNAPTEITNVRPRQSGAKALQERQRVLNDADKPGPTGSGPHGALTVNSHGVFGLPGLFLTSGAPVPAIVASGQDVELQNGAQIVLRLDSVAP
jgi:hypothetical protein